MKKHYVYELINQLGTVEYVGCTHRPKGRFKDHTKKKLAPGNGKFYGRQDLIMHIVKEFDTRNEAELYEGELKLSHNMEWTELTWQIKGIKLMKDTYSQPITVWDYLTGDYIGEWYSISEAARRLTELKGIMVNHAKICNVLSGKRNHHQGMIFKRI